MAAPEITWDMLDVMKLYVTGVGLFSGVTVLLYPISVVKTRMQVASKDTAERSVSSVVKGLIKKDGIRGFYKGFATVLNGAIPARIVFLTSLETIKEASFEMVKPFKLSETSQAAIANGIAGLTSSIVSQVVYTPIDVISQKLMVQGYSGHAQYSGGLDVARKLIRSEGFKGLYRGFTLSVITYAPSNAVWWATYGSSQRFLWRFLEDDVKSEEATPSLPKIILVQAGGGLIAGATASCITTPLDTIKTRLQVTQHGKKISIKQVIKELIREDGWKGVYRGFFPRLISTSAWGTSMVVTYEYLKRLCVKKDEAAASQ